MGGKRFHVQAIRQGDLVIKTCHGPCHRALLVCLILSPLTLVAYTQTHLPSLTTTSNEGEAAAMAAMFQAQSANWEETQEKMSQLVSPLALLPVSCSNLSNTYLRPFHRGLFFFPLFFFFSPPSSVRPGFTPMHVERVSVAEVASRLHHTTNRTTGRSRPVTCATVAARKVCTLSLAPPYRVHV